MASNVARVIVSVEVAVVGYHGEIGVDRRTGVVQFDEGAFGDTVDRDVR